MSKLQRIGVLGVRALGAGVALCAVAFAANCGSSSTDDNPAVDSGPGSDVGSDVVIPTDGAAKDGDTAKPPGDSAVPDLASTLITEGVFQPLQATGMTTDDNFIAIDDAGNAVAIPVSGTAPIVITDGAAVTQVVVVGKTVFVWKTVNKTTNVGTLFVWTKAGGAKQLTTTSILGEASASEDGSVVVYSDNGRTGGKVFDYSIAKSDGTGVQKAVITNVMEDATKCAPQTGFAGNTAVVAWCSSVTAGGDGGADATADVGTDDSGDAAVAVIPATVSSIDPSGTVATLKTNAVPAYRASKDGTKISLLTETGSLSVLTLGGAETPIDTGVTFGGVFTPDGASILYVGAAGIFKKATVGATPAPVTLVATGVTTFYNPFPGATHYLYGTKQDKTGTLSDLNLVPVGGGATAVLDANPDGTIFGDEFTADHSLVTYYSPAVGTTGTLLAADPAAPATPKTIATKSWVAYSPKTTMIVYNDNYVDSGSTDSGTADLKIVEAKSGTPQLIATQAGADFYLTTARDKIVYATVDPSVKAGLYWTAVP